MESQSEEIQILAMKEHCHFCFDAIISQLRKIKNPLFPYNIPNVSCPLFVTWKTKDDELRGCIGTFSDKELETGLMEYARISAFQDSRFNPIQEHELPHLTVHVSLLVKFESGMGAYDWVIGTHGIIIDFIHNKKKYNATFLPEVASENQWDHKTTLKHLIRKTGFKYEWEEAIPLITLKRYQSSHEKLTYKEYIEFAGQAQKTGLVQQKQQYNIMQ